jgi:hypothetical protein
MNTYEQKQADRKGRYLELSGKAKSQSSETATQAHELSNLLPFGQPVLVGHHSEGKHRRHIEKMHNTMSKAIELDKKADYYEDKAHGVGTGGISSDDPEAVQKLNEKIESLKWHNEKMKESNKLWRKTYNKVAKKMGLKNRTGKEAFYANEEEIKAFKVAIEDFKNIDKEASNCLLKQINQYSYNCTKQNPYGTDTAEIRRLEKRVKDLRAVANFEYKEIVEDSYKLVQDAEENRLMFYFDGKPTEEIRKILKSHGFKWSPSRKAWVRMITANAMYSVRLAMEALDNLENGEVVA